MKIMIGKEAVDSNECYGEFNDDGKFIITQKQMARIHNDFNVYYLNKSMCGSVMTKSFNAIQYSFKPLLCETSLTMVNSPQGNLDRTSTTKLLDKFEKLKENQEMYY